MNPAPFTIKCPFGAERGGVKRTIPFILLFFLLILQTTSLNRLSILRIKPDLLLILVIFLGLHRGPLSGAGYGFLAGILLDIFSPVPLGTNALPKTILGFLAGAVAPFLYFETPFIPGLLLFLGMFLEGMILFLLLSSFHLAPSFSYSLLYIILPASLYTSLLTPFFFYIFKRIIPVRSISNRKVGNHAF